MADGKGHEQCDGCGYTLKDAILHQDHHLCGAEPPWMAIFDGPRDSPDYTEAFEAAVSQAPYGWEAELRRERDS